MSGRRSTSCTRERSSTGSARETKCQQRGFVTRFDHKGLTSKNLGVKAKKGRSWTARGVLQVSELIRKRWESKAKRTVGVVLRVVGDH